VARPQDIQWTNKSVLRLGRGGDPIAVIEKKARDLALRALDAGWSGPPFNPIRIADLLNIQVEANASVPDARIISKNQRLTIQYNPTQPRARVRFTIAHELAHTLFPDVAEEVRNRGGNKSIPDDWQLEVLCNIAAAEFVMPLGSMPPTDRLPSMEELMLERKRFDVSAEAFLIRAIKMTSEPVMMFCASAIRPESDAVQYRIDYAISSRTAPTLPIRGQFVPSGSAVHSCTAIGYSDKKTEDWFSYKKVRVECVGIPAFLGASTPRVAGLIRFSRSESHDPLKFVHGNVLDPGGDSKKVICQLVNDKARFWGGGVARSTSQKFPGAQREFSDWLVRTPRSQRLGSVHFAEINDSLVIASLVGQEGFGATAAPRIRYLALEQCFEKVSLFAVKKSASVHMPRIGSGQSGGQWEAVEEIVRSTLLPSSIPVTVYDLPPKKAAAPPSGLFD
jgi:O-acetyl-ADP-ribose deacetylase (regulator of RNase III)